jgi:serine/threonine-protein kinase HipA
LHFVGETIDKRRAHAQAQSGDLVPLIRGVYADAQDEIDDAVLEHAIRIAHYLYPAAYLSSAKVSLVRRQSSRFRPNRSSDEQAARIASTPNRAA